MNNDEKDRILLDSDLACRRELERVSASLALLTPDYIRDRERLGKLERQLDLLAARTLIDTEGANKEEREAKVLVTLWDDPETAPLMEEAHKLNVALEVFAQRFKTLEKRGSHAQSAIKSHQQESRFDTRVNL